MDISLDSPTKKVWDTVVQQCADKGYLEVKNFLALTIAAKQSLTDIQDNYSIGTLPGHLFVCLPSATLKRLAHTAEQVHREKPIDVRNFCLIAPALPNRSKLNFPMRILQAVLVFCAQDTASAQ